MKTTTVYRGAKATLHVGRSPNGTRRPQIDLEFAPGTSHRMVNAALYSLAAGAERVSTVGAPWVVVVDLCERRVYLELVDGAPHEEELGMGALRSVLE